MNTVVSFLDQTTKLVSIDLVELRLKTVLNPRIPHPELVLVAKLLYCMPKANLVQIDK